MNRLISMGAVAGAFVAGFMALQRIGHMPGYAAETARFIGNMVGGAIAGTLIAWAYGRTTKQR